MGKVIAIVSGKGGVGKTMITANLAVAMSKLGKRVAMVDTDLQMANLGLALGMESRPFTLQDVLLGLADLEDAMYDIYEGVKLIPAGLSVDKGYRADHDKLEALIDKIARTFDFVLLDCPAGMSSNTMSPVYSANKLLVVTAPEPAAITNALKSIMISKGRLGVNSCEVVLNRVRGLRNEMKKADVEEILKMPVIAAIPEDTEVAESALANRLYIVEHPNSEISKTMLEMANRLITGSYLTNHAHNIHRLSLNVAR